MKKVGAYLPGAYEEVVDIVDAYVLTEKVSSTRLMFAYSYTANACTVFPGQICSL